MNVNTPSANYSADVKGVFHGATDSFDPSRHQITPTVAAGKRFRTAIRSRAQAVKAEAVRPIPNPLEYTDVNTGERNSVVTPGGMGCLVGSRLKVDAADPAQGVYFVAADGTATKVQLLGQNKPGELMFIAPALPAGEYTLEVRAVLRGSKELRTGVLPAVLTAA